ncbi:MAG: TlpA family protein disulfide reductase [Spirochaetes bacterium]|nr:TlpA family protein disulfide reductase [Spirochaetota bacterium]
MKIRKIVISVLTIVLFLSVYSCLIVEAKNTILKKGDKAPKILLYDLQNKFFKSGNVFNKKIVVVNFWATYCKPCEKETPELIKMAKEYKDKDVVILFVSLDKEGSKKVSPFLKEHKFEIPSEDVLLDIYKITAQKYGVTKLPSLFVVDKNGKITYSCVGYKKSNLENVNRTLEELTKK